MKVFFRTFATVFAQEGIYVEEGDEAGKTTKTDSANEK